MMEAMVSDPSAQVFAAISGAGGEGRPLSVQDRDDTFGAFLVGLSGGCSGNLSRNPIRRALARFFHVPR
jgi:hypothetical protein